MSPEEREKAIEELRHYSKVYVCRKCRRIYGSDLNVDNGICVVCSEAKEKK